MPDRKIIFMILLFQISACTTTHEVIVDDKRINPDAYSRDLSDCRVLADQVDFTGKALKGAGSGALMGGISGVIHDEGLKGLAVGSLFGGVSGLDEGEKQRKGVVKSCLRHRGYIVLN